MENSINCRKGLIVYGVIIIDNTLYHVCNSKYKHAEAFIVEIIQKTIKKYGISRTIRMIHKQCFFLYRMRCDKTIGSSKSCIHCCHMMRKSLPKQILKKLTIIWSDKDGEFYQTPAHKMWNNYISTKERLMKIKKKK